MTSRGASGKSSWRGRPGSAIRRRLRRAAVLVTAATCLASVATPTAATETTVAGSRYVAEEYGHGAAVATESRYATEAAFAVLRSGGTAVDAAFAAAFTMGVVRAETCGIGGGGFLTYRGADGTVDTLDFRETAPSSPQYTYRSGTGTFPETGRGVVGVPGLVAGAAEAIAKYGNPALTRGDLLAEAIRLADQGFRLSPQTRATLIRRLPEFRLFPASFEEWYVKDPQVEFDWIWRPRDEHEPQTLKTLARTMQRIADSGWSEFYTGETARLIAKYMAEISPYQAIGDASEMTAQDLASYRAIWRTPVESTYRGRQVIGMGMPASGGIAVAETLNLLEGFDLSTAGFGSADHLHLLAEAQKLAFADRGAYVGDPAFVPHALDVQRELSSDAYAERRRAALDPAVAQGEVAPGEVQSTTATSGSDSAPEGPQTTNVSVIDAKGNAAALTCSLEQGFGSATTVPGAGFILNGQLYDFTPPNHIDDSSPNKPAPGKRPRSSMSPTIVVERGAPVLVTGAQGGAKIILGVVQAVVNTIDHGMPLGLAVDAPRVDARGYHFYRQPEDCWSGAARPSPNSVTTLEIEDKRFSADVLDELRRRGHELRCVGQYAADPAPLAGEATLTSVSAQGQGAVRRAVTDPRSSENYPRSPEHPAGSGMAAVG